MEHDHYRTREEIVKEVLVYCLDPKKRTKIMFANNFSHAQLKRYLKNLVAKGLLEEKDSAES